MKSSIGEGSALVERCSTGVELSIVRYVQWEPGSHGISVRSANGDAVAWELGEGGAWIEPTVGRGRVDLAWTNM